MWVVEGSELCHGCWWWFMLTPPVENCNAWSLDLCILVCREPSFCFTLWDNSVTWALQISRFIMHSKYKEIFFHKQVNSIQEKALLLLLHFFQIHMNLQRVCAKLVNLFSEVLWIWKLSIIMLLLSLREIKKICRVHVIKTHVDLRPFFIWQRMMVYS